MGKEYLYSVGEVVGKGTLKIVAQTRDEKYNRKAYLVQSLTYPNSKNNYILCEGDIVREKTDGYLTCRRICDENSLYSIERIRKNIIDIEEAKTIAPRAGKYILFKCEYDDCNYTKKMRPAELCRQGFSCNICSKGVSYPELHFASYNSIKNAGFISQQRFEDFPNHIFDFVNYKRRIIVETHGLTHYEDMGNETSWKDSHKKALLSDERKRKYCKENNWTLIELDCRYSTFEYIRNSIANETLLEDITDNEIDDMLGIIEKNKRYPLKDIVKMYTIEMKTTVEIGEALNINHATVGNILRKNNVSLRDSGTAKKKIKCVETGIIYDSGYHAMRETGISNKSISSVCNKKQKVAGGYTWEFIG